MSAEVSQATVIATVAGMAAANFAIRFMPIAILSKLELPRPFLRWLSYVPISVMGALVATQVVAPNGEMQPPLTNPAVWAALLTALVFRVTRSFLGATVAGMAAYVVLRTLL